MKIEDIKKMAQAWNQVQEATYGKKKEAMDPVDAKELKGKHKDRKDKDIDNDGDVDKSDEYLHKRRKAVSKAMKGKQIETEVQESVELDEEYGIVRYPDTSISYVKKKGSDWHHIHDKSYGFKGKVDRKDLKHMSPIEKDKIPSRLHKEEVDLSDFTQEELIDFMMTEDFAQLDELSKKTLGSYIKKADKQADKAADSYSNAAMRRSDFAPDTPAMAKNAKKFAKRDAGADLARRKLAKESVELDELSKKTLGSYVKKASDDMADNAYTLGAKDPLKPKGSWNKAFKRRKGIEKATDKLTKEAKDHGNMNNGSPRGEGLSPSAKKELDRTTPMNPATDQPTVDKKTFDAIRASGKKAPMRSNDNAQGDKTMPKNDGK